LLVKRGRPERLLLAERGASPKYADTSGATVS
jgi:hypothetical protein